MSTRLSALLLLIAVAFPAIAQKRDRVQVPRIWDGKALEDWATPIAALGVRPGHFTPAEYYAEPADNLRTYPVYRPDKEPPGYWEWLQKQKPQPLIDISNINAREDWIKAGDSAFRTLDDPSLGLWYRGPFEHNGSVASLEDWFDARRLRDDYVPTGFKPFGVASRPVKGHEFGLGLSPSDKDALVAFLRTI
jgi:hypothetical protein